MKKIDVGDTELAVYDRGNGPVLLLVHGFPLDHTMWDHQAQQFARGMRVVAPDLRGFGQNDPAEDVLPMDRHADDLAALLRAMDIHEPVSYCGLSMGGYIAWQFWQRHGELLDRLVLCDTRAVGDTEEVRRGREIMAQHVLLKGPSVAADAMLPRLVGPDTPEQQPDVVEALKRMVLGTPKETIAAAQRGMALRPDMTGRLDQIEMPTLVICGEHDEISPPDEMGAIADAIRGAQFAVIPDAGHMAPMENPEAVNTAIREFLDL